MSGPKGALPVLDFSSWTVPFPERGARAFLPSAHLTEVMADDPAPGTPGLWLLRAASGVGVVMPVDIEVVRGGSPVVGLAVLHHGERIEFANRLARYYEVQRIILEPGSRLIGRKCPLCHVPLRAGQLLIRCPLCGEGYCADCWEQLSGSRCCSRNCQFSPDALVEDAS
jgi:hypothetical protein